MNPPKKPILLDARSVEPGTKLELKDGSIVVITENPGDGIWLFCRPVGEAEAGERPLFAEDVLGFAD